MLDAFDRITSGLRRSQMLRLFSVGFLALVLQIPIAMIGSRVAERQARRDEAVLEVSSKWGNAQSLTGPALVVPYTHQWTEALLDRPVTRAETRYAVFLPERLRLSGSIDSEARSRGIFSIPVYRLDLAVEGEFERPDFSELGVSPAAVDWAHAQLAIGISDVRAIQQASAVSWNGAAAAFLPGVGQFADGGAGIHAVVAVPERADAIAFSFPIVLNGSQGVSFAPFGQTTAVSLRSNYAHPSFQGNWLPSERAITDSSFEATWSIPYLGRNYPQAWLTHGDSMLNAIEGSRFGVNLIDPVDHYRMAERSVKYAGLFILLTFAAVWLIEVLAGVRVHPIQYLLLGSALCLFYLLELSLSEHLGFLASYAIASTSVVAMVSLYSAAILGRASRAVVVGSGVALLYAYLYTLLINEDYALLAGSIGLFAILGAIMYATRHIDWYGIGTQRQTG